MPRPSAHIHELIWAGVAPSAVAAWKTIATELVKPTSTATKPAVAAGSDRSRRNWRMRELDLDLGPQLDDAVGREAQEVGRGRRVAMHLREQLLAPAGHAAAQRRDDDVARQEVRGLHVVELE